MSSKEEIKTNQNIDVNKPTFYDKNTTKFNTDNNNFNERTNNTLNQQQDAINKTLDNTLNNVKRTTEEASREIPRYTQRIAEYQEQTIQTIKDIASDFIEAQKQIISSFQTQQVDKNSGGVWNLFLCFDIVRSNIFYSLNSFFLIFSNTLCISWYFSCSFISSSFYII